jgi:hypothetical protein
MADGVSRVIWTIIWLIILIVLSIWVAGLSAFVYIIVSIFTPCIKGLEPLKDIALKGLNFPHYCSQNVLTGDAYTSV